jgi:hypothetical protein
VTRRPRPASAAADLVLLTVAAVLFAAGLAWARLRTLTRGDTRP